MGWYPSLSFMHCGDRFNKHRKLLQQYFSRQGCLHFHNLQTQEARALVKSLFGNPGDYDRIVRRSVFLCIDSDSLQLRVLDYSKCRFSTAIVMKITYGYQVTSEGDEYVQLAEDVQHAVGDTGAPGGTLVDLFPFCASFRSAVSVPLLVSA